MALVLLIEDDGDSRAALAELLEMEQHEVVEAGTVVAAIEALERCPDAVITDLGLPDGDGWQVVSALVERGCSARVALLTGGETHPPSAELGRRIGLTLRKPLALARLLAWLGNGEGRG